MVESDFNAIDHKEKGERQDFAEASRKIYYPEFVEMMTRITQNHNITISDPDVRKMSSTHLSPRVQSFALSTDELLRSRVQDSGLTMKQAFQRFDMNNSGSIERDDMMAVLSAFHIPYTPEHVDSLFQSFDLNRDGKFQYGEFVRMMQKNSVS